jgi:hypothetical protein
MLPLLSMTRPTVTGILERLQGSVFVYLEIVFAERGNQSAFFVLRSCVQDYYVHIHADGEVVIGMVFRWRGFLAVS